MSDLLFSTFEQSVLYLPLLLGVIISFTVMKIPDLSIDGTFVLGAAVFAKIASGTSSPFLAVFVAIIFGAAAGIITALIQYKDKVPALIAGILVVFVLYSVNLIVMGKPNIGLISVQTPFKIFYANTNPLIVKIIFVVPIIFLFLAIFKSSLGLYLRAFGDNKNLLIAFNRPCETFRVLGLSISSALVSYSGCLHAQSNGFADINMGLGQALLGIIMILMGQQFAAKLSSVLNISFSPLVSYIVSLTGALIYFFLVNLSLYLGVSPLYIKLVTGLFLAMFLFFNAKNIFSVGF